MTRVRRTRAPELRTWLRIVHVSVVAFTIPEVITLVLHPVFQRAAVDEALGGSRNLTVSQKKGAIGDDPNPHRFHPLAVAFYAAGPSLR